MTQRLFTIFVCSLFLCACTSKQYRRSADKEVARIFQQKTSLVPNMDPQFTIETTNQLSLSNLVVFDKSEEAFGAESEIEKGARILTLQEALDIASKHSNEYQTRKEDLYLKVLELTSVRHSYTPLFSGDVTISDTHTKITDPFDVNQVIDSHSAQVSGRASVSSLLRTGGRLSAAFTSDFLRIVSGDPRATPNSAVAAELVQPLLRGAGYTVAIERLTQAERDTLYALRDFTRFRQDFSSRIASEYYGVLQNRDAVRNNWRGLQNYKQTVARERAFFDEGLRSQASLDQLKQAELQTQTDWISAIRSYRQALDRFKVHIGLNTDSRFILDDRELQQLTIIHPELKIEEAVNVAMVSRLDLDTERDQLADSARHVKIAANGLLPQLDFKAYVDVNRTDSAFPVPDWQRQSWGASLGLDLPIDRLRERNVYRASLIALDRSKRNFNTAVDTVKVQIADDWRNLDQAKRTYEIRELGVQIAARRVEEQQLRQELGRGTTRDLVDAQSDLISSKNQRTAALISHTLARLSLFRDMGMLWIKDNGQWDEKAPPSPAK